MKSQKRKWNKKRDSVENLSLPQTVFRVAVLGPGGVGKTSLITRFTDNEFTEDCQPTVEDLYEHGSLNLTQQIGAVFDILDTAGSYPFPAMRRLTIERSDAFVLVYSVNDESSLHEILRIRDQIVESRGVDTVPIVIVANKCDIPEEDRELSYEKISETLTEAKVKCLSIKASAKYGMNAKAVFTGLLAEIALRHRVRLLKLGFR